MGFAGITISRGSFALGQSRVKVSTTESHQCRSLAVGAFDLVLTAPCLLLHSSLSLTLINKCRKRSCRFLGYTDVVGL